MEDAYSHYFFFNTFESTMSNQLQSFYLNKKEPVKSCLFALQAIILNHDKSISETTKYGMPCFCVNGKAMCYLWTDKKTTEPYLLMVEGKLLDHPELEEGDRKRMKILRVNPNEDLPVNTIKSILNAALELIQQI